MKRKGILILAAAILLLFGWSQRHRFQTATSPGVDLVDEKTAEKPSATAAVLPPTLHSQQTKDSDRVVDRSPSPQVSLRRMSQLIAYAVKPGARMEEVVKYLKDSGQEPVVTKNSNPDTGNMFIIRTKSPLPGTRYFHAQYFTDERGQTFAQHVSFEFRPGPTSFVDAVRSVQETFGVGKPQQGRSDYALWDLDDDYEVTVNKLSARNLPDDPFNAYDPAKDDGTVQVTAELKIHGKPGEDDHSH